MASMTPDYPPADDIGEILISRDEISARVAELGVRIAEDFAGQTPLLVGVLKGSAIFVADLLRAIPGPVEVDFLAVSSYGQATQSSGVVKILKDLDSDIEGRPVILVEDIIDSGLTLNYLLKNLSVRQPASLQLAALLVKDGIQRVPIDVRYEGFRIPPDFVIGYGLDFEGKYRNLPYVAVMEED